MMNCRIKLGLTSYSYFNRIIGIRQYKHQNVSYNTEADDEFYEDDTYENIPSFVGNNSSDIGHYKQAMAQLEIDSQRGKTMPIRIDEHKWLDIKLAKTYKQKLSLYNFWRSCELSHRNNKLDKASMSKLKILPPLVPNLGSTSCFPPYRLACNALFYRIRDTKIKQFYEYQLASSMLLGPHLVIDCSYERYMNTKEIHHCYTQLSFILSNNIQSTNPFDIIFCNMAHNSPVLRKLKRKNANFDSILRCTEKSYLDFFEPEELIYLSPHSDTTLDRYNGNYTYIVGAFVDEAKPNQLSKEKAAEHGIKTAKFPISDHLHLMKGNELLPLNQVVDILSKLKNGLDWSEALKSISRKWSLNPFSFHSDSKEKMYDTSFLREHYEREKIVGERLKTTLQQIRNAKSGHPTNSTMENNYSK